MEQPSGRGGRALSSCVAVIVAMLGLAGECFGQRASSLIRKGNEQFHAGSFSDALKSYESAAKADPGSREARFNQGVAAYRSGDVDSAQRLFREVDSSGGNPELAAAARYNLGVIETQRLRDDPPEDPKKALSSLESAASLFRGALDLSPGDGDAARNLELTRLAIRELKQQIERMKEFQQRMKDLQDELKQNQQDQQEASEQNQERAGDEQPDEDQKGPAKQQQERISEQTRSAREKLEDLRKQLGDESESPSEAPEADGEGEEGDQGTPKAERVEGPPTPQDRLRKATEALDEAREKQDQAEEQIGRGDLSEAEKRQHEAADRIKEALERLAGKQEQNQDEGEQDAPPEDQPSGEQQQEQQAEEQSSPPPEEQGEPMQQQEGEGETSTDARLGRILEKERRDREMKQQILRQQRARNRPVDKDW